MDPLPETRPTARDLLNRFLAAFGAGGATLRVELDDDSHPRGALVRGRAVLVGGRARQRGSGVSVSLTGYSRAGGMAGVESRERWELSGPFVVGPGEEKEFPFALSMWDAAPLTLSDSQGVTLKAEASLGWVVTPSASAALRVTPHHEVLAVYRALVQMGFPNDFTPAAQPHGRSAVASRFVAPAALRDQIDALTLSLWVDGEGVNGTLALHRRPHSLRERLTALTGAESPHLYLKFERAALRDERGGLRPENALPILRSALAQALILPENLEGWMLRPASGPDAPDELLRPAVFAPETVPAELLRPAPETREDAPAPRRNPTRG